jgi:hypothetical protein
MSSKIVTKITIRNPPIIFDNDKQMEVFKTKIAKILSLKTNQIDFVYKEVIRVESIFKDGL